MATGNEVEMFELPQHCVDEEVIKFRYVGMLEQIYRARPQQPPMYYIPQDGQGQVPFTKTIMGTGEGGTDILEKFGGGCSWQGPGLIVGVAVTEMGSLVSMEMIEF